MATKASALWDTALYTMLCLASVVFGFPPSESVSRGTTPLALCLSPCLPLPVLGAPPLSLLVFVVSSGAVSVVFLCCSPSCVLSARGPAEIVLGHLLCYISPSYLRVRRWGVGTLGLTEDFSFWHSLSSSVVFTWFDLLV